MANVAAMKAVVQAAKGHLSQAVSGHVFSLYFPFWNPETWDRLDKNAKLPALQQVIKARGGAELGSALQQRQQQLAEASGALTIEAASTSPFVTGMGEKHAVENGFAFLSPYGLPYLAGSGVKGVIRRAAEELAAGLNPDGNGDWTFTRVMWLFGFEGNAGWMEKDPEKGRAELLAPAWEEEREAFKNDPDEEVARLANLLGRGKEEKVDAFFKRLRSDDAHLAGALAFWDVIIAGNLDIDILTPHYGEYYQGNESPHDAGQPQPNPFLVVAPGAQFTFHIACAEHHLPETLRGETWRKLVRAAFDHAFAWGGFGAKTAVGYGVLQPAALSPAPASSPSDAKQAQAIPATSPSSSMASSPFRSGQRVLDPDSGETGLIKEVRGDIAIVDFDGVEDEVPLRQLKTV